MKICNVADAWLPQVKVEFAWHAVCRQFIDHLVLARTGDHAGGHVDVITLSQKVHKLMA
jgi:hypothetical protein